MIQYVRKVDFDSYQGVGYEYQMMFVGESCRVIASHVAAGGAAPPQHIHEVDQLYYVCFGEMHVQLGAEEFVAGPNTLVHIPAGTPHHNWNAGTGHEFHFELLAPGPNPNYQPWEEVDSTDAGGRPYFVKPLDEDRSTWDTIEPGYDRTVFLRSPNAMLYLAELAAGGKGPDWHIHRHDQMYYVLEGELTADVALEHDVVPAHHLIVLPAGVPHRVWNASAARERHLVVNTPLLQTKPGERGDLPVTFASAPRAS